MELNPVFVKELRSRMRGARGFLLITIYLAIMGGAMLMLYLALSATESTQINAGQRIGQALFYVVAGVALFEVCFITPLLTAGSVSGERERETYDLLISSLLSPWQIVTGKLAAALAYASLLILSVVPLLSLAFLFGGVSLSQLLIALIGMLTTALLYASIGLFWSSRSKSTLGASSLALGSVMVILLGIPFIALVLSLFSNGSDEWQSESLTFYGGNILLSLHPFFAMLQTEAFIREGRNLFYTQVATPNGQFLLLGPWLIYLILAVLLSILMLWRSSHHLQTRISR
jgi:ABC-type transport system involved in multi-copper enzyme maturation permease subunit